MKILELLTAKRKIGNKGESAAAAYLKKHGYKILKRNYVAFENEIDIIAESKDTLAFIEVKTRTLGRENAKEPRPASAVTPQKQRKIICAAKYYIGGRNLQKQVSLDVIEVYLTADGKVSDVIHMKNTFTKNTAYSRG